MGELVWTGMTENCGGPEVADRSPGLLCGKEQRPQFYNHRDLNTIGNTVSLKHDSELPEEDQDQNALILASK